MPSQINLTSSTNNASILFATDEWFACAHHLLDPAPPTFDPDAYCPEGKVMDGWETRRKRIPGHDWCIIKLGNVNSNSSGGKIAATNTTNKPKNKAAKKVTMTHIEIDTAFFTGNYVPRISIWGTRGGESMTTIRNATLGTRGTCATIDEVREAERVCGMYDWVEILGVTELGAGYQETRHHKFQVRVGDDAADGLKYLRVNYFPDGGVARLKVWADVDEDDANSVDGGGGNDGGKLIDFAAEVNGGRGVGCSNRHYGEPSNLLKEGRGKDMGDGWETARHTERPPILKLMEGSNLVDFGGLMDWAIVELGGVAENGVERIVVDTAHFKGNFPESVRVEGCHVSNGGDDEDRCDEFVCRAPGDDDDVGWFSLLPRAHVFADSVHTFENEIINKDKKVSHIRVTIYPDGGISRIRIYGKGPLIRKHVFQRSHL